MRLGAIDISDFSGGLNTKDGPGAIADNEYAEGKNVYLVGGGIAKRKGYSRYNSSARIDTAEYGTGIFEVPFTSGTQIIGVAGSKIAKKGSGSWTDISGSVAVTAEKPCVHTMINNNLVVVNGNDPAWYYSGSGNAATLSGNNIPTSPKTCETFHGRLFLSDGRDLWWSEYMNNWNNAFKSSNNQAFESDIIAAKVLGTANASTMYVMTNNNIYSCVFDALISEQVGGDGVFRFDHVTNQHGCISPQSPQECYTKSGDLVLIWADKDGLKALSSGNKIVKLTENIQPTWDDLNISQLSDAVGVFYKPKNWYLLFCCGSNSTTHDTVIVYDVEKWVTVGVFDWTTSFAGIVSINGVDSLVGSDYSGYWNQYDDEQSDNESAIDSYFTTKVYDGNMPLHEKGYRSVTVVYAALGAYTINILAQYDFLATSYSTSIETKAASGLDLFVLDQDLLGGADMEASQGTLLKGRGKMIQLRIGNNEADEPFRIHRILATFTPGKLVLAR